MWGWQFGYGTYGSPMPFWTSSKRLGVILKAISRGTAQATQGDASLQVCNCVLEPTNRASFCNVGPVRPSFSWAVAGGAVEGSPAPAPQQCSAFIPSPEAFLAGSLHFSFSFLFWLQCGVVLRDRPWPLFHLLARRAMSRPAFYPRGFQSAPKWPSWQLLLVAQRQRQQSLGGPGTEAHVRYLQVFMKGH